MIKRILVVGGANGIGLSIAKELAALAIWKRRMICSYRNTKKCLRTFSHAIRQIFVQKANIVMNIN